MDEVQWPVGHNGLASVIIKKVPEARFQSCIILGGSTQNRDHMFLYPGRDFFGQMTYSVELGIAAAPIGYESNGDQLTSKTVELGIQEKRHKRLNALLKM